MRHWFDVLLLNSCQRSKFEKRTTTDVNRVAIVFELSRESLLNLYEYVTIAPFIFYKLTMKKV